MERIAIIGARFYFDCVVVANEHDFIVPAHFFRFWVAEGIFEWGLIVE